MGALTLTVLETMVAFAASASRMSSSERCPSLCGIDKTSLTSSLRFTASPQCSSLKAIEYDPRMVREGGGGGGGGRRGVATSLRGQSRAHAVGCRGVESARA